MQNESADEIRHRLVELYALAKPDIAKVSEYSTQAAALTEEYCQKRLAEAFPRAEFLELVPVVTLDARQSPASLDSQLSQLTGVQIDLIIWDRFRHQAQIFAKKKGTK